MTEIPIACRDEIKKHESKFFWASFILYIILGLVVLILTGMVLMGGQNRKGLIWTLYAFNIIFLILTVLALFLRERMSKHYKLIAGMSLLLQFIFNISALVLTNDAGNVGQAGANGQATTGRYTSAVVFTLFSFLIGLPALYFDAT